MRFSIAFFLLTIISCSPAVPPSGTAPVVMPDQATLFIGGLVVAGPAQTPEHGFGVVVQDGRIFEVGPADFLRTRFPSAKVVDAPGATILPGLVDAHGHLYGLGLALDIVDLVDTTSFDEVVERVRSRAASTPPGEWIIGRGWDQNDWDAQEFPTSELLDRIVPAHPVMLRRIDGHALIANRAAMRAAGVTAASQEPSGGRIVRDARGEPTGVFIDAAMELVERSIPPVTRDQRKSRVLAAARAIASAGLTGMHDAGIDAETIAVVKELIDEGQLPIRVYAMLSDNASLLDTWFASGPLVDYGERLTIRSVKLYADGALGSRGAALLAPYDDDPHNHGLTLASPAHIENVARRGRTAGFQVNTHAIGDAAVRSVIEAYERTDVTPTDRFRIEHLQVIAPDDVPRLVEQGTIASVQPTHATSDMYWAEQRLGPERILGAYAWRTLVNAGVRLALGSDFPVEQVNPFHGISAAVTRQDRKGWPPGGWYPEERLSLREAIRGFTLDAAFAAFGEQSRGTIEPGKIADFTIVEGDLFAMPSSELDDARVLYTVVGGEIVHQVK
ncbi:MAG TPA: amidohydrolase [Thermoanaerobaculia bacterium]